MALLIVVGNQLFKIECHIQFANWHVALQDYK